MARDPRVFEYCDAPLPFPPGQSPFHIKGQFYIQAMRALQQLGKPLDALYPTTSAPSATRFLASQWYDVLFFRLAMIEADARGSRDVWFTRQQAYRAAEHGLGDIQALLAGAWQKWPCAVSARAWYRPSSSSMISGRRRSSPLAYTLTIERRDVPLCMIEWWSITRLCREGADACRREAGDHASLR
jgi:hypothetical protein